MTIGASSTLNRLKDRLRMKAMNHWEPLKQQKLRSAMALESMFELIFDYAA